MITILIILFVPILLTCIGLALAGSPTIDYNTPFRRELLPPPQDSVISDHPLLDRPPNPDLDIVRSKSGKPPIAYTYAQSLRGKPIARYYPDTDTLELASHVQDEHEDVVCDMLYAEVL
jgi:hypothetical protein